MKFIEYIENASKIKFKKENTKLNLAILRSYTCENIEPIIKTELYNESFNINIEFGIFNQYYQEVMDKNSFLYTNDIDIVLILLRAEDIFPKIYKVEYKSDLEKYKEQVLANIKNIIEAIKNNSNIKAIIMTNMDEYENEAEGILEYNSINSTISFLKKFNIELLKLKEESSIFYLLDINKIVNELGKNNVYNNKMKFISKDPYTIPFYINLAKNIKRTIRAILKPSKKVLALDLDNTLYKGILGEDGIDKITNFEEYPGEHYKNLQTKIKNLKNRGILLALVTKNNLSDVQELFKTQKMPLQLEDFVSIKANWENKYENLNQIAKELNLDLNSFVFIDDNPYEIELINKKLPEVETVQISLKPEEAENVLEQIISFDKLYISEEDKNKTQTYKVRDIINIKNYESIDEFLKDLKMEISFKIIKNEDKQLIERASQMTMKTNQFNMTTKRYTVQEIEKLVQDSNNHIIMLFVKDKFGNHGSVGLVILKNNEIDTFLLSCRVLKRKIEYCVLEFAKNIVKQRLGKQEILAKYIKTDKNQAFKDFYKTAGMKIQENGYYKLVVTQPVKEVPDYIIIKSEEKIAKKLL